MSKGIGKLEEWNSCMNRQVWIRLSMTHIRISAVYNCYMFYITINSYMYELFMNNHIYFRFINSYIYKRIINNRVNDMFMLIRV